MQISSGRSRWAPHHIDRQKKTKTRNIHSTLPFIKCNSKYFCLAKLSRRNKRVECIQGEGGDGGEGGEGIIGTAWTLSWYNLIPVTTILTLLYWRFKWMSHQMSWPKKVIIWGFYRYWTFLFIRREAPLYHSEKIHFPVKISFRQREYLYCWYTLGWHLTVRKCLTMISI